MYVWYPPFLMRDILGELIHMAVRHNNFEAYTMWHNQLNTFKLRLLLRDMMNESV